MSKGENKSKDVYKYGVNVREFNEQHWEFVRNLTKEEIGCCGYGVYKCKACSGEMRRQTRSFKNKLFICPNNCNGTRNGGDILFRGINDLATTHPHLVVYLANEEDKHNYKANTHKKLKLKCPLCGEIKEMPLGRLVRQGFGCPICSDGISFPEKFVGYLLKELSVDFQKQKSLDGRTRYDFYLPTYNTIIEVHGEQHFIKSFKNLNARNLNEEKENDGYKRRLALDRGIKYYIELDCRKSTLEWIRNGVMNSSLPTLLEFEELDIAWEEIEIKSRGSLMSEVCVYFKQSGDKITNIAKKFNLDESTVYKYLNRGTQIGLCNYNNDVKMQNLENGWREGSLKRGKSIKGTQIKTGEEIIFLSSGEAGRWLFNQKMTTNKRPQSNISSCALGRRKSAYGYTWHYIDQDEQVS